MAREWKIVDFDPALDSGASLPDHEEASEDGEVSD